MRASKYLSEIVTDTCKITCEITCGTTCVWVPRIAIPLYSICHDSETYRMTQHCAACNIRLERRHINRKTILLFYPVENYNSTKYRYHNYLIRRFLRGFQFTGLFHNPISMETSLLPSASVHYEYRLEGC